MLNRIALVALVLGVLACQTLPPRTIGPPPGTPPAPFGLLPPSALWSSTVTICAKIPAVPKTASPTLLIGKEGGFVYALGTGTIVGKDDSGLLILTAKHVVAKSIEIQVASADHVFSAKVVRAHPIEDLALLHAGAGKWRRSRVGVAPVGSSCPAPGGLLWVGGNSLGLGIVVSWGPMGSNQAYFTGRERLARGSYNSLPGCSGGGVWHGEELVGVVSRVFVDIETKQIFTHIGLFVPADTVYAFLKPKK